MSYTECNVKNKRFRIHQSIYNTYSLYAGQTDTHNHTPITRYIVQALVVSPTQPSPPHTHARTTTHRQQQHHNIVPFQSTTNTFATFNLHFTAAHTTTQPSTYLYLFHRLRAIQPHTYKKNINKSTTRWLS